MAPRTIIWIFTARCNLQCPHCYASIYARDRELSINEKIRLIREMSEIGVEHIGLSGGEPLIHRDLPLILKEIFDHGMTITMVTNGTIINEYILDLLAKYDVYLYVSIDGPREVHDRLRGPGVYDRVMETINALRNRGIEYATIMAVGKYNYKYTSEYIDIASKVNAEHAALIPVMPSGRAYLNKLWINASEYYSAMKKAIDRARETSYPVAFWCTPFLRLVSSYENSWTYYCRTMKTVDIGCAGELLLCDVLDIVVSNARVKGLRKALHEYYANPIINNIVYPRNLPRKCMNCSIKDVCRGGCYARSYILRGGFNKGDPLCPIISDINIDH